MIGKRKIDGTARAMAPELDLLLREMIHRGSNDLQMIVGLLALQSSRAASLEVKQALADAMERVSVLARARREMGRNSQLSTALQQICDALQPSAEPRSITISLSVEEEIVGLTTIQITTLALVVNELATNAIKHAFEEGMGGYIHITQSSNGTGDIKILVDDDGLPFPAQNHPGRSGLGLELSKRLMASIGGLFIPPRFGAKIFELRLPVIASRK